MNRRKTLASIALASGIIAGGFALVGSTVSASPVVLVPDCAEEPGDDTNYPPLPPCEPEPELFVSQLDPVCELDAPYLAYSVSVTGNVTSNTLSITFIGAGGQTHTISGLPLSGKVLFPGAVVDPATGHGVDWPGWSQDASGNWVEGDEWSWVRPIVTVVLEVNPSASASVGYPPGTPECRTSPDIGVSPQPPTPETPEVFELPATA